MRENQFSTWFSHDEYVGVKCMRTLYSPITSAALVSKSGSLDTMCRSSLCHLPRQLQSELTPVSPPPPWPCAGSRTATTPGLRAPAGGYQAHPRATICATDRAAPSRERARAWRLRRRPPPQPPAAGPTPPPLPPPLPPPPPPS